MTTVVNTSSTIFAAFLQCPTKCYLYSAGERGAGNSYAHWVQEQEEGYKKQAIDRLRQRFPPRDVSVGPPAEDLRAAKWGLAVDLQVRAKNTESCLHAVERVASGGPSRSVQFIPVRCLPRNKLTRSDRLLLAFDALSLSESLGREVSRGKIMHGDDYVLRKVNVGPLLRETRKVIAQIAALLASGSPPELVLNRHCTECEFRDRCRPKLIEKDDLSLLSRMTAQERKEYHDKGISTVPQLSYTFRPRRRPKHLREKREKYHLPLKALAVREKKIYVVGSPELKIEGTPVYLDVEGMPDRDFYYLIGLRIGTGDTAVHHSFWADDPSQERIVWEGFLHLLSSVKDPVLIYYGSYETTFLKAMSERYGGPPEGSAAAKSISSSINLLSFIFAQIYFPTYSNGLKEIAGCLGFKWTEADASGIQAIEWRERWEQSRNDSYRAKLISYNAQDCEALDVVTGAVGRLLTREAEPSQSGPADRQVIRTDDLKEAHLSRWCKFTSPIKELVEITNCAHWDYQRERVYFRSSKVLKRLRKRKPPSPKWHVDMTVQPPFNSVCPVCGHKGVRKGPVRSRCAQELIFGRFSLKRRLVRYDYQPYWCRRCKKLFGVDESLLKPGKRQKYGRSLLAYLFYQMIELYIPAQIAFQSANKLFGLALQAGTFGLYKQQIAAYYAPTQEQILARIVAGHLVHADETYVSIRGKRAYVWVFTNMHEVVYVYSATREAEVVQGILKDFKGVLVSDFYAAYDAIPCPQQKCLIHLARDLNGELLDHPFDEDLKTIIASFGVLVRGIVATIDRHGLKRHFLHKHGADVKRFYRTLIDAEHQSPAATACADRFQKNRDRLFTFLDHDGVPWNNNNAEHAMKAFARLREVLRGTPTESGLREYLVLLSICQTCQYQGLDFLEFLRSGEMDISAFAQKRARRKGPRSMNRSEDRNTDDPMIEPRDG
jgi:predicted RecB family nuclease